MIWRMRHALNYIVVCSDTCSQRAAIHDCSQCLCRRAVDFLVNVECLEGQFDTWGVFGQGFIGDLALGGPKPVGAKKANLTDEVRMFLAEVALNEQGALLCCPARVAHCVVLSVVLS